MINIHIFIAIALDESIFLDVLHFPMKNIKSRDQKGQRLWAGWRHNQPVTLFVYYCCRDVGRVSPWRWARKFDVLAVLKLR